MKKFLTLFFGLVISGSAFAQLPSNVPTNSLIAFWPLDGNANDVSGNNLHGNTGNSIPTLSANRFNTANSAYYFNGTNSLVIVPYNAALGGMSDLSISAWINVDTLSGIQHIVSKWDFSSCSTGGGDAYCGAFINSGLHMPTNNNNTGFTSPAVMSNTIINTWKHVVFINNSAAGQSIYVDGVLAATNNAPGSICASTNSLFIGCSQAGGTGTTRHFKGEIDDIGLWKRVLTPCEIFRLYAEGLLPSASASSNTICAGSAVTLSASGLSSYTWMPGTLTGSVVSANPVSSTIYTVTAANAAGCTVTSTVAVAVNQSTNMSVSALANPSLVCPGNTSTLIASGAQNYTWQPGGIPGSVITVTPPLNTTYTVVGESQGCTDTAVVSVNIGRIVNVIPFGSFCNSATVNIGVAGLSSTDSLVWSGPGISGVIGGSVISTTVPGNFTVVVTDTVTGCSGTGTINIPPAIPAFSIIPSTTVVCFPGPPINLLVSLSANLSWAPAAEVSPNIGPLVSVNPSVTTTYTVLATLGSCTSSAAITISVNYVPSVIPIYGDTVSCYGKTITLSAGGADDFHWMPANITGSVVNVSPFHSTTYTITGFIGACSNTTTYAVKVNPAPAINAFMHPPIICVGQTAILEVVGAPTTAWIVSDPPVISPTVAVSPDVTTQYSAMGSNSLGCISFVTVELKVIQSPAITATASAYSICSGQSVTLAALGIGSHTWHPGPVFADSIVVTPTISTMYTVLADTTICGYVTVMIQVNNCENRHLGIAYNFDTPVLYNGDFFKVNAQVVVNNNSSSQMDAVNLSTDLDQLCPYPLTYVIHSGPSISQNSQLSINHNFNGSSNKNLTDTFALLSAGSIDTIYFSLVLDPHGFAGQLKGSVTGSARDIFGIIARDTSHKGLIWDPDNDGDPTNNNDLTPLEIPLIDLFIPSGFSPNGDGINDKFVIKGLNARSADLLIFNRWGNKVYEKSNYDNSWDGSAEAGVTLGKGKLPDGVYYYILQFQDKDKEIQKGFIVMKY